MFPFIPDNNTVTFGGRQIFQSNNLKNFSNKRICVKYSKRQCLRHTACHQGTYNGIGETREYEVINKTNQYIWMLNVWKWCVIAPGQLRNSWKRLMKEMKCVIECWKTEFRQIKKEGKGIPDVQKWCPKTVPERECIWEFKGLGLWSNCLWFKGPSSTSNIVDIQWMVIHLGMTNRYDKAAWRSSIKNTSWLYKA